MPKFRDRATGVVVSRRDDAPALPVMAWEPVETESKTSARRTRKPADKSDEK